MVTSQPQESPNPRLEVRNRSLDGLRGVAILLVVLCHADIPLVKYGGIAGVTLFFVLSGYLITSLLVSEQRRTGTISLRRFYVRRALRLLPALIVALLGGVVLAVSFGAEPARVLTAAGFGLFYVSNFWPVLDIDMRPFTQFWSLSLEEQYYLFWPLLLLLTRRWRTRWVIGGALGLMSASLVARFLGPITTLPGYNRAQYLPYSSVWAIIAGSLIALVFHHRPQIRIPPWTRHLGLVGLLFIATVVGLRAGLREQFSGLALIIHLAAGPTVAVFCVLLVANCVNREVPRTWLTHPVLLFFGRISYALYLWHGIMDIVLRDQFGATGLRGLAVGTATAVLATGVAVASGRWVEAPFMRKKAHLERHWENEKIAVGRLANQ